MLAGIEPHQPTTIVRSTSASRDQGKGSVNPIFLVLGVVAGLDRARIDPAERLKAASRQGLVQNCEQAIKAALWDPGSYVFVDHLYVANDINGVDVRLTYLENDGYGGRDQWQTTCSYHL